MVLKLFSFLKLCASKGLLAQVALIIPIYTYYITRVRAGFISKKRKIIFVSLKISLYLHQNNSNVYL